MGPGSPPAGRMPRLSPAPPSPDLPSIQMSIEVTAFSDTDFAVCLGRHLARVPHHAWLVVRCRP